MRIFVIASSLLLISCATASKDKKEPLETLSKKTLAVGECGLYVWKSDAAKTFTLFAAPSEISYIVDGRTISLIEKNPTTPPSTNRSFMNKAGKSLSLTLLSPENIDGGIRYKSGRLTSVSEDGWEKVVPIVGLYACQPTT